MIVLAVTLIPQVKKIVKTETQNHLDDSVTGYSTDIVSLVNNLTTQLGMLRIDDYSNQEENKKPDHKQDQGFTLESSVSNIVSQNEYITQITVIDSDGNVRYSTDNNKSNTNMSSEEDVTSVLNTKTKLIRCETSEEGTFIYFYIPVMNGEHLSGGVVAVADSNRMLEELVSNMSFTGIPAPRAYIADENGLIIAHINAESVGNTIASDNTIMMKALDNVQNGRIEKTALNGTYIHELGNVYVSCISIEDLN